MAFLQYAHAQLGYHQQYGRYFTGSVLSYEGHTEAFNYGDHLCRVAVYGV